MESLDQARKRLDDEFGQVRRKLDPGPRFPWEQVLAAIPLQPLEP